MEALSLAVRFSRLMGARLDLLHVLSPFTVPAEALDLQGEWDEYNAERRREVEARLRQIVSEKVPESVRTETLVREGTPASVITTVAGDQRSNLLIISTQGLTGLKRFLLGSVAETVVRQAPCPVLAFRGRSPARTAFPEKATAIGFDRVLVPVDFSASTPTLVKYAVQFAKQFQSRLLLLHVVEHINAPTRLVRLATGLQMVVLERGIRRLNDLASRLVPPEIKTDKIVRVGTPYDIIRSIARAEKAELIIIATRGYGAVKGFFLGSTAGRVVRHSPCPVLVTR